MAEHPGHELEIVPFAQTSPWSQTTVATTTFRAGCSCRLWTAAGPNRDTLADLWAEHVRASAAVNGRQAVAVQDRLTSAWYLRVGPPTSPRQIRPENGIGGWYSEEEALAEAREMGFEVAGG